MVKYRLVHNYLRYIAGTVAIKVLLQRQWINPGEYRQMQYNKSRKQQSKTKYFAYWIRIFAIKHVAQMPLQAVEENVHSLSGSLISDVCDTRSI